MQYRKFILSLADDGTQEAELNRFLRGHRILKVEQQRFLHFKNEGN